MSSRLSHVPLVAPASQRMAEGRPVMSREQVTSIGTMLLDLIVPKTARIWIDHTMQVVTRMADGQVILADDGDVIEIRFDEGRIGGNVQVRTNQLDEATLRAIARRFNAIGRDWGENETLFADMPDQQDTFVPVQLWHDATIRAMRDMRATLLPEILGAVGREGLRASGFVGFTAKSHAVFCKGGTSAFSEETDCELTVTARTSDGKSSGWGGQAARDWARIVPHVAVAHAIDMCKRGVGAQAIEPGRRTVILTSEAAAQIMRYFAGELSAAETIDRKNTPFTSDTHPGGARYNERMFDPRITMNSDPADPDGGYCPWFWWAWANSPTTWIQNGVLKELAWSPYLAATHGRSRYADDPHSIRISGGTTTIEEMIAQCKEGIFVNRFSGVDLISRRTGMMTGVTRDGCFLIKNGKLDRPVKNFRFLDSPFFMLNNIVALGATKRAAYGYTPPTEMEFGAVRDWPRLPIIVPPMMIRDFNFSALSDAV